MHVIAGFESQIAARGGAFAIIDAALKQGLHVSGAALARRDTERAIHVDPLRGFAMPEHVLQALDDVVDEVADSPGLDPGETALVVAITGASRSDVASCLDGAMSDGLGALWVDVKPRSALAPQSRD